MEVATFMSCVITIMYKCDLFLGPHSILLKDVSAELFNIYDSHSHQKICRAAQAGDLCLRGDILHWAQTAIYSNTSEFLQEASQALIGQTLVMGVLYLRPHVVSVPDSEGTKAWVGTEMDIANIIAEKFGFTWTTSEVGDDEFLGSYNESMEMYQDGLYGRTIKMEFDASISQVLYELDHHRPGLRPLSGYERDGLCFLFRGESPMSNWIKIIRPFDAYVWGGLVLCSLAGALGLRLLKSLKKFDGNPLMSIWRLQMGQSMQMNSWEPSPQVFFLPFLMSLIVIKSGYGAVLLSFLTVQVFPKPIQTIRELEISGRPVLTLVYSDWLLFQGAGFPKLASNVVQGNRDTMYDDLLELDGAMIDTITTFEYDIRRRYTDEFGITDMQVLAECWSVYDVVILFQDRSPFVEILQPTMSRLVEGGIYERIKKQYMEFSGNLVRVTKSLQGAKSTTLKDLQIPFIILSILLAVSCVIFGLEMVLQTA